MQPTPYDGPGTGVAYFSVTTLVVKGNTVTGATKPAILEALRNRPATCSPDCYELKPGVWIHRPHAGCITIRLEASAAQHKLR